MVVQNRTALLQSVRDMKFLVEKAQKDGVDFSDPEVINWFRKRDDFRAAANRCYTLRHGTTPPDGTDWIDQEPIDFPTSSGWQSAQQKKAQQKQKP